jgi:hypothetical protein
MAAISAPQLLQSSKFLKQLLSLVFSSTSEVGAYVNHITHQTTLIQHMQLLLLKLSSDGEGNGAQTTASMRLATA